MSIGGEEGTTWELPTWRAAAWFQVRVWGHVLWRGFRDVCKPAVRHHGVLDRLRDAPVIAERRTALWRDGHDNEFLLVAGKVHNLRLARSAFDGVFVPAGSVFSFWRQLGRPTRWRGFVEGREVRAGCVVPTIAGGLCQLSNALASCAFEGGMTLTERHGHTARVERHEGPDGLGAIDATVFWNYVDLRFVASFDFRVEVELTPTELVVRLRAADTVRPIARQPLTTIVPIGKGEPSKPVARGCLTCNETACFRHRTRTARAAGGSTAVLVNAWTPEFARHLHGLAGEADWLIPWIRSARRVTGSWPPLLSRQHTHTVAFLASLRRSLHLRRHAGEGGGRQAAILQGDRWIAERYARRLQAHHTHLVVDQSLLVPLADTGVLGGRTYEVLVHALPARELQRRLDAAALRWPDAASLRDFRISDAYCAVEIDALRGARLLVTPHADVARHLQSSINGPLVQAIEWILPSPRPRILRAETTPMIAFPASALARKGAHEMAEAMRQLGWRLLVLGTPPSDPRLWSGIDVTYGSLRDPTWLARADVVALPAHVEHLPRGLLAAIAHGVPVVASPACGLPSSFRPIEVSSGDVSGLIAALRQALQPLGRH